MTPKKRVPPLTEDQKKSLQEWFQDVPDINLLTQRLYGEKDDNGKVIDGRHALGRQVKKFLTSKGLKPSTTAKSTRNLPDLTLEQKELAVSEINNGATLISIARLIYNDDDLQMLSAEWRKVHEFFNLECPELLPDSEKMAGAYRCPNDLKSLVMKVNAALGTKINEEKISGKYKACFDKLMVNLKNSRFVRVCNTYTIKKDRDLFIDEFIRLTFDKPDLTPDEINQYINICVDTVSLEILRQKKNLLDEIFLRIEDADELNQRFSENLKATTDEYNQTSKRINDVTKKLQGDRSERLKSQSRNDYSFLSLVQVFQDEEERREMLRQAEMERLASEEEANRLESLPEWKARILGAHKEDLTG